MQPMLVAFFDQRSFEMESKRGFGSIKVTEKIGIVMDESIDKSLLKIIS